MNIETQLSRNWTEAYLSSEEAARSLIEDNKLLNDASRYHYIMQYGSKRAEMARLELAMAALGIAKPNKPA